MNKRLAARRLLSRSTTQNSKQQRRAMLFESLEGRALLAAITGNTAIGGFELLSSSSLLYQLSASTFGPVANGTPITAWNNSGTAANNFTQGNVAKQPTYLGTGLGTNNLPGVVFDGSVAGAGGNPVVAPNADELLLTNSTSPASVFIVNSTAIANTTLDGIWGLENGDYGIRRSGSNNWQNPGGGFNSEMYINGVSGSNPSAPLGSDHILTATRAPGTAIATTSIGDYFQVTTNAARSWGGQIGDVIAFTRTVSDLERQVIENALSAKYDIPLAGGDIYQGDNGAAGNYDQGVFGVGGIVLENVAIGKSTSQSSTRTAGGTSNRAVDGNTNGVFGGNSITHNVDEEAPWWEVDLGTSQDLYYMNIFNRQEGLQSRLANVQITTISGVTTTFTSTLLNPDPAGAPNLLVFDFLAANGGVPVVGQKVRITLQDADTLPDEVLSLAEVQIFAPQARTNAALGKATSQSSDSSGGVSSRGVDGNTNGSFGVGSVTHTNSEINPWWMVDLGSNTPITQVNLYNRTDCCMDRFQDVRIQILDAANAVLATSPLLNPVNNMPGETGGVSNPFLLSWDFAGSNGGLPITGRKIRVQMEDAVNAQILSLAEVQVFTPAATIPAITTAGQAGFGIETASNTGTLLAGYKQSTNSIVNTDLATGVDSRWDRAWYVDKTGTMNATLAFDFSDAGLTVPASTVGYQLLYNANNNFEASNSSFSALNITPTVVGDLVTFSVPNATLLDGYYTLGLLDQAATLAPSSTTASNGTADAWRIVRSGGGVNLDFYNGATLVRTSPYASITSVTVTGSNDNDTFTVDQTGGVIARPVNYAGNGQTSTPGDSLVINGGTATTITHTFTNNSDGNVNIDGSVITYTGLEPITDNMVVANRSFTFNGGTETITISDVGGANGQTRIDSTLGEFVDFSVPSATLAITTNGGDTTAINSFDAAFNTPSITLIDNIGPTSNYNLGAANIIFNGSALTLTGNVNFSLNGFSEQIAALSSTNATPTVTLSAGQTLTVGDATSTTFSGNIVGGGNLTKTGTGTLTLTGTNTYGGSTNISQGTLQLGNGATTGILNAASTVTLGDAGTGANNVAFLVNRSDVNNHANPIVVSALGTGTATIGSVGTAAGSFATIFDGTVTLNRATTMQGTDPDRTTFTNVISGNVGTLTVNGGARTTWQNNDTFVGNVVVATAGTVLQIGGAGNQIPDASDLDLAAGTFLRLNADGEAINQLTGSGTVENIAGANTLTIGSNNGGGTFTGNFNNNSGALSVTKTGTGTATFSGTGATNYGATGLLTVNQGTLIVGAGFTGDGAWAGNVTINNTAILQMAQANIFENADDFTINTGGTLNMATFSDAIGNLAGGGSITGSTGITLDDLSATFTYSGTIAAGGFLNLRGAVASTGTQILSGSSYGFTSVGVGRATLTFNGAPTVAITNTFSVGDTTIAGVASGAITAVANINGGTITVGHLEVGNRQSGTATVNATVNHAGGTMTIGGAPADGANLRVGHWPATTTNYNLSGTGVLTASTGVGAAVDGDGTFTQTGGTLNTPVVIVNLRNNNGTGIFNFNGGTANVGAGGFTTFGTIGTNSFLNLGGGTIRATATFSTTHPATLTNTTGPAIFDTNGNNITWNAALSGAGGLNKNVGTGNLTLTATNTYGGATNVNAGVLQLQNGAAILDTAPAVSVGLGATLQLLNSETISSYNGAGDGIGSNDSLLALGANTLTTTGNAAIANVSTAAGAGIIAGGSITDTDDDNNITGTDVYLQAATGIGTAVDPIETAVGSIQLNNSTSGVININNSNAGALLTVSNIRPLGFGAQNLGGAATIVTAGPLTIASNVTAAGNVVLSTIDSAGSENLVVNNTSVTIQSTTGTVTLNAGDNVTVPATARLAAVGNVTVNVDVGNADPGTGGGVSFAGDVDAALAIFNGVTDTVGDGFNIRPDQDVGGLTPIQVFGFGPASGVFPAGDGLTIDITGLGVPTLTLGPGARNGSFSFGGLAAPLTYNNIETIASDPPGSTFHVVLDMRYAGYQDTVADNILMQLDATGTNLLLDVNAAPVFNGPKSDIESLTIIGSSDNDALTIQETAGGLPRFNSGAPVDNSGIGGGVSAGSHLNSSADLVLEVLRPAQTPWNAADVTIHFDGGAAGTDSLTINYTTLNNTGYFSDTSDAGNSGNVLAAPGVFPLVGAPTLLLSVANLEPLNLSGAGGALLVDATGTAATANITLTDIGAQTQLVADGGVATTTFSGFTSAVVVGGGGAELIDILSIDNATLTSLQVVGGNTNDLVTFPGGDNSADTIRLRTLPSTASALLQGSAGSDNFQLYDGTSTVDNIQGPVVVDGADGSAVGNTDTLTILDIGDLLGGDNVVIGAVNAGASQDYFIDGINSTVSTDVVFRNIDVLDYTATTFNDVIDGRFVNTLPAHDLSTVNLSGWTGGDQFLLFTSDQFGGTGTFTPTATASGVANINLYGDSPGNLNGGDIADTFGELPPGIILTGATNVGLVVPSTVRLIRPSASTAIAIDGGEPTGLAAPLGDAAGDVHNIDISGLPNTNEVIVSTFAPGTVVATGVQPLTWTQIEDINLVDQGKLTNVQMGDLFARTTPGADFIQMTLNPTPANPYQVRLRITDFNRNFSASNKTIIYGGGQNDNITQANLTIPAEIYGEGGDDIISGGINNDWLVGGLGNDRINGSQGDNVIWGDNSPTNPGDLTPQTSPTGGDDILSGLGGDDVFYGSGGNDLVSAGGGSDYASGGAGADTLDGQAGDDRLYGGGGDDILSGAGGNDLLSGGGQNDELYGDTGNDVLFGGTGADLIDGGAGNDLLISGSVFNEASIWTSVANTTTFSAATYTAGGDNDNALLTLLALWGSTGSNSTGLAAITHDGANDDLFGSTGDDDFCWEAADIVEHFPLTTPPDYLAPGMGADQRIPPNS